MRHRVICAAKRDFRTLYCTCTCMPHLSCHCLRRYILSSASDHGASCTHTCRPGLSFHILGRFNILSSVCIRPRDVLPAARALAHLIYTVTFIMTIIMTRMVVFTMTSTIVVVVTMMMFRFILLFSVYPQQNRWWW